MKNKLKNIISEKFFFFGNVICRNKFKKKNLTIVLISI
jgi:hypothetical protein